PRLPAIACSRGTLQCSQGLRSSATPLSFGDERAHVGAVRTPLAIRIVPRIASGAATRCARGGVLLRELQKLGSCGAQVPVSIRIRAPRVVGFIRHDRDAIRIPDEASKAGFLKCPRPRRIEFYFQISGIHLLYLKLRTPCA